MPIMALQTDGLAELGTPAKKFLCAKYNQRIVRLLLYQFLRNPEAHE